VIRLLLICLLVLFVARAVWRLLSGVVEGATAAGPRASRAPDRGTRMVRDPICGTFVVQSRALSADSRGETAWFCSEDCRRTWQVTRRTARAD
jgi:YHS domain-containing protein